MATQALRRAQIEIVPIPGGDFLQIARRYARSQEVGPVSTQYENELASGEAGYGALGLMSCGNAVAVISYSCLPLPHQPSARSGRIDVVATVDFCRGFGLATIIIGGLIQRLLEQHGESLVHFSTIAVHPAIAKIVEKFGFTRLETGDTPLYSRRIEKEQTADLLRDATAEVGRGISRLRARCMQCQRYRWVDPWCIAPSSKGAGS